MPSLGADMQFGTVVAWLVKPGDQVKRGDVVAEVETEKGVFAVEIGSGGTIDEISVAKGAKVPVGTVLARLRKEGPTTAAPTAVPAPTPTAPPVPVPVPVPVVSTPTSHAVRASPLARKIAESEGVNLASIVGTGPGGAITKADVERAAHPEPPPSTISREPTPPAPSAPPSAPPSSPPSAPPSAEAATDATLAMRHAVAATVARSKREIPHYYLGTDVNLTPALAWLATHNESRPVTDRVLPAVLLLKAVAVALRAFPALNGFWIEDAHNPSKEIHLGIAISLRGGGLIAPAIHEADRLSVDDLMRALSDLVRRARSGGLRSSEMMDATVTVSNLGDEGASSVFGIIYPPQVAIIGFGKIAERAWAEGGMLGVRSVVTVTLAADHRATDGHYGGRFLAEINRLLQAPESL